MSSRPHVLLTATVLVLALAGCGQDPSAPGADSTPPATDVPSATDQPSPPASDPTPEPAPVTAAVYFVVDTRTGLRLARELTDLPGEDLGAAAVRAMIAGPRDPDYSSSWNPRTRVRSVTERAGVVAVDLSRAARTANVGSAGAATMVQQLVWTVTEALGTDAPVQLLIAGRPAGELWGAVSWDRPVARDDALDVRLLVQIDTPREGATSGPRVRVRGDAAAFEANVPWRVLDESGEVVRRGFTMTTDGTRFAPYSFSVRLAPGTYTIEVSEDDPSGGEAGPVMVDTRTVRVQ